MKENFIHFIWQYQYFDKSGLKTCKGEKLNILTTGFYNRDSGPDFLEAKIESGGVTWCGQIEIHLKSSDWFKHKHHHDKVYDNVVLHVVYKHDKAIYRTDGSEIPTLELHNRVNPELIKKYTQLVTSKTKHIPCSNSIPFLPPVLKLSMLDAALVSRLQNKAQQVLEILESCKGSWEETSFRLLCKNMGFKLNSEPFYQLSKSISFKTLKKHADQVFQVEALLFGLAGMLEHGSSDQYYRDLKKEYHFLENKYGLKEQKLKAEIWKFLRTRPSNFPTLRIAQLSKLITCLPNIFSSFTEEKDLNLLRKKLKINPSEYWQNHYAFGKKWSKKSHSMGEESINNILINTLAPILAALAIYHNKQELFERATCFLEKLPPENHSISRNWKTLGLNQDHAADTQAGLELFNAYCKNKLCLDCRIGTHLIKN